CVLNVLISAFGCEPNRGSEPGIGWNWVLQAARHHKVWVITWAAQREAIEDHFGASTPDNITFIYHDLPRWLRFRRNDSDGSASFQAYYLLWQWTARSVARRL